MPGAILVSVLEFMDLPSSSSFSSISIKVSMGKREYQTWDKGDFSFPLTTLRDNLVVLLQDAEGNEISHAGIETKSIVEKGLWDDLFPLKTGGFVHMKLQFVLNEEERNRILTLRESALKKKQGEFINSSPSSVQSTSSAGTNVASPLCFPNEVSDRNEETSSVITLHQRVDLPLIESKEGKLVERSGAHPLPANLGPARAICADESSRLLRRSQSIVRATSLPNLQEDRHHNLEKQGPVKKTPSNVKKMISAFESGSAEDMRPHIKPPPMKVQSNKTKTGAPLEIQILKVDKKVYTETTDSKGVVSHLPSGVLQLDSTCGEEIHLLGDSDGTKSSDDNGHNADSGTGVEVNGNEKNQIPRKLKVENSEDAETSGGLVGQAIKVAIMIGFGTLVLLTRQRRN